MCVLCDNVYIYARIRPGPGGRDSGSLFLSSTRARSEARSTTGARHLRQTPSAHLFLFVGDFVTWVFYYAGPTSYSRYSYEVWKKTGKIATCTESCIIGYKLFLNISSSQFVFFFPFFLTTAYFVDACPYRVFEVGHKMTLNAIKYSTFFPRQERK